MKHLYFIILSFALALSSPCIQASSKEDLAEENLSHKNKKRSSNNNNIALINKKNSKKTKVSNENKNNENKKNESNETDEMSRQVRLQIFNTSLDIIKEKKEGIKLIELRNLIIKEKIPLILPKNLTHPMYDIVKSMAKAKPRSMYYNKNVKFINGTKSFVWVENNDPKSQKNEKNHSDNEESEEDNDSSCGLSTEEDKNEDDLKKDKDNINNIIEGIKEKEDKNKENIIERNNIIESNNINNSSNSNIFMNILESENDNKDKSTHDDFISISDSSLDSKKEKIILWNREEVANELKNIQTLHSLRKMDLESVKNEIRNINNDIKNYNEIIVNLKKDKKKTKKEPEQKNIIKEQIKNTKKILNESETKLKNYEGFENTLSLNIGMQNNYKNSLENAEEKHKKLEKITRKIEKLQNKKLSLNNDIAELHPELSLNKKQFINSEKQISMNKKKIDIKDVKKIEIKKEN